MYHKYVQHNNHGGLRAGKESSSKMGYNNLKFGQLGNIFDTKMNKFFRLMHLEIYLKDFKIKWVVSKIQHIKIHYYL